MRSLEESNQHFQKALGRLSLGVKADLCTFAKALGNGYPISAVAGREDIVRTVGDGVVHGGTFTGHCLQDA